MPSMKRIPSEIAERDQNFIRDMMGIPHTNRKQLEMSRKALTEIIQNDLTPRQRELIFLRYYQNMNNKQIAALLSLDASSVSRTLKRARIRIYKLLHVYLEYLRHVKLEE